MFKMTYNVPIKPVYTPPTPNIIAKPLASPVVFGSIFAPMIPNGPCTSCGNSK